MESSQCTPRSTVRALLSELKSCTLRKDLQWGRSIHANAVHTGTQSNAYIATALIRMYARCCSIAEAHSVFDTIQKPNVLAWTALILGYAENGKGSASLELFRKMKADGCVPDSVTFLAVLKACKSVALSDAKEHGLKVGRSIHLKIGNRSDNFVQSSLIDMYAKCGSMVDARQAFNRIHKPDVACWNVLLLGYADNGQGDVCLELFPKMKADGCAPDSVTYVAVLKACTSLAVSGDDSVKAYYLAIGRGIHSQVGDRMDRYVQNTLIDMYAKCGSMFYARQVFARSPNPDLVSWNALLLGYAENGEGHVALKLFSRMKANGRTPDTVTFVAVLKACTSLAGIGKAQALEMGSKIHLLIGNPNVYVQSTLIDMYAKCGSMVRARQVFDSIQKPEVVSWTALLLGYAENGEGQVSLDLFFKMKNEKRVPDSVTYIGVLKACISLAVNGDGSTKTYALKMGRRIHVEIGEHSNLHVQNSLIDMYCKCGSMVDARNVFHSVKTPSVVSWNALLLGYADNGEADICLELFSKMNAKGCAPDSVTYGAALKSCVSLSVNGEKAYSLKAGREIHSQIGEQLNIYVQSTLIEMYAKCGSMVCAREVFDSILKPDVVSWNVLLLGYAENGEGCVSLDLYSKMKTNGCAPNSFTYVAVLKACASIGALGPGRKLHSEVSDFTVHVVTCLVDLYARCGSMVEARKVFDSNCKTRDITTWTALLAGYSTCGDTDSVLSLFEAMQDMGFRPDSVTFLCILMCCSHAGLATKARQYLEAMPVQYGVTPDAYHYNCMVDGLSRANQLNEAVALSREMPCNPNAVTWTTLLGACRKGKNVELARMAFQALVEMDRKDASAYVFMAQIYGSHSMWEEQARVLKIYGSHSM